MSVADRDEQVGRQAQAPTFTRLTASHDGHREGQLRPDCASLDQVKNRLRFPAFLAAHDSVVLALQIAIDRRVCAMPGLSSGPASRVRV